jgi:GxxExxY protein
VGKACGSRGIDFWGTAELRIVPAMHDLVQEETTEAIIGAFYEVYNTLGFGFLEHIYVMALERELIARGRHVAREVAVRVMYKGEQLSAQRLDMIVDGKVIVENPQ